jgi:glycosyltransferase involved in cell wall biosynthesis
VPPGDAAALRAAIAYLLEHRDSAEALGANGRRAVEASYTVEQFVERFAAVIRPSLNASPGSPRTAAPPPGDCQTGDRGST